jgi:glycine cleavage system H protein
MSEIQEYQDGLLWRTEDGASLLVGVTQVGLDMVGAVSEMEVADLEDEFEAGDWIGEVRGKNAVLEIVAPCALRVTERNEEVLGQPSLLEDDPTGDAWLLRVERLDG